MRMAAKPLVRLMKTAHFFLCVVGRKRGRKQFPISTVLYVNRRWTVPGSKEGGEGREGRGGCDKEAARVRVDVTTLSARARL